MAETKDELDALAGEYVLGTLVGEDRQRFEQRLAEEASVQQAVASWEERLVVFNDRGLKPPASVWQGIERRLDADNAPAGQKDLWWHSLLLWRTLTAAAVLGLVLVVGMPLVFPPAAPEPVYSLVMKGEKTTPQWLVTVNWRVRSLNVTRLAAPEQQDKDYELWLLPKGGNAPVSLGVLRGNEIVHSLPADLPADQAKAFAVSLEPSGGSPTGAPTGPVLYVAPAPAEEV